MLSVAFDTSKTEDQSSVNLLAHTHTNVPTDGERPIERLTPAGEGALPFLSTNTCKHGKAGQENDRPEEPAGSGVELQSVNDEGRGSTVGTIGIQAFEFYYLFIILLVI